MTKVYPAIIHQEDGYWVEFPDLSGCFTNGSTLEETMEMAQEAEENNLSLSKILQDALKERLNVG